MACRCRKRERKDDRSGLDGFDWTSEWLSDQRGPVNKSLAETEWTKPGPSELGKAIKEAPVGKKLPDALYVHVTAVDTLPKLLYRQLKRAVDIAGEVEYDLVKLNRNGLVSLLSYPDFMDDPHPALSRAVTVNPETGNVRDQDYSQRQSPPILHRKEQFLDPSHPRVSDFKKLTDQEKKHGLLGRPDIGTRGKWEGLLSEKGLMIEDNQVRTASSFKKPTREMVDFFEKRTLEHINRVIKYMKQLEGYSDLTHDELIERAQLHDQDKYSSREMALPYCWVTEYHRQNNEGEVDSETQRQYDLAKDATGRHVEQNLHHPEAHQSIEDMSQLDLAEMVADWSAMAEELGEGNARGWADQNIGSKWEFTDKQKDFIYGAIDWLEDRELRKGAMNKTAARSLVLCEVDTNYFTDDDNRWVIEVVKQRKGPDKWTAQDLYNYDPSDKYRRGGLFDSFEEAVAFVEKKSRSSVTVERQTQAEVTYKGHLYREAEEARRPAHPMCAYCKKRRARWPSRDPRFCTKDHAAWEGYDSVSLAEWEVDEETGEGHWQRY